MNWFRTVIKEPSDQKMEDQDMLKIIFSIVCGLVRRIRQSFCLYLVQSGESLEMFHSHKTSLKLSYAIYQAKFVTCDCE